MAEEYAQRLQALIDSASDKEEVRKSIGARLYLNATMGSNVPPKSSKDAEIDAIIREFEGDNEMSSEISDLMQIDGGRRKKRKTRRGGKTGGRRKLTRKTRKTRKYSRRR
jgi:hypothetical protein